MASLTSLPLSVVLTHAHVDHAFGASAFDEVYLDPADHGVLSQHVALAKDAQEAAIAAGEVVQPLPDPQRLLPLVDGHVFDLGGLHVEVHSAPGHTPGSAFLLLVEERILVTGDGANQFTFLFVPGASTVDDYRTMILGLGEKLHGRYDRVLVSHGDGEMPNTLLADLAAICDTILDGKDDAQPFEFMDMHGLIARRVDFEQPFPSTANIVYDPDRLTSITAGTTT